MPGIAAMRSTSATASSTPIGGTSAAPPKRSGACAQNVGQVVVVDAGHGEVEVAVGRVDDPVEAVREQQLGVDAVEVERLDARLGVVAAGVDVLEATPEPLLVGRAARARAPVERARRVAAREDPGVALLEALHAGHLIAVLRGRGESTGRAGPSGGRRPRSAGTRGGL